MLRICKMMIGNSVHGDHDSPIDPIAGCSEVT